MLQRISLGGTLTLKYLLLTVIFLILLLSKELTERASANAQYIRLEGMTVPYSHAIPNRCLQVLEIGSDQVPTLQLEIDDLWRTIQSNKLPHLNSAWRLLGRLSWLVGDLSRAQVALLRDQEISGNPMTRMELGVLAALQGRPAEAAEVLRGLGYSPGVLVQRGNQLLGVGQFEESLACYTLAAEMDPSLYLARLGKARSLQMLGRNTLAMEAFNSALQLCPSSFSSSVEILQAELCATGYIFRGHARIALGEPPDQVEADFLMARRIAPGNYGDELNWVYWLVSQGRLGEARPLAEQLLRAYPSEVEPYALLAGIYLAEGQTGSAVKLIDQASQIFPDSSVIQKLREENKLQP